MFGVGCSFSDNAREREMRSKIMDQAAKGWICAGELSEEAGDHPQQDVPINTADRLSHDDMFVVAHDGEPQPVDTSKERPCLIAHPFKSRRNR